MDKCTAMDVLDRAIVSAAREKYAFLRQTRRDNIELVKSIEAALKALQNLQTGARPDYKDDWIALFYLLWFQPKQINLAYSLIKETLTQVPAMNPFLKQGATLHVVDFGCGSLAMQFAVCLAAADAIEENGTIPAVKIDSIDSSNAMIKLGKAAWDKFSKMAVQDKGLETLRVSSESMLNETHLGIPGRVDDVQAETRWLSAFHTVYEDNTVPVGRSIQYLKERLNPDLGIVTTHYGKDTFAREVSPYSEDHNYRPVDLSNLQPLFSGVLPLTYEFRCELRKMALDPLCRQDFIDSNIDVNLITNYLNYPLKWEWPGEFSLAYMRI